MCGIFGVLHEDPRFMQSEMVQRLINVVMWRGKKTIARKIVYDAMLQLENKAKGDKEKAMFALGHILHLIEDSSVPDHTRNDPHPNDSPYEKWTSKFILARRKKNK